MTVKGFSLLFISIFYFHNPALGQMVSDRDFNQKHQKYMECLKDNFCRSDTKIPLDLKPNASFSEKKYRVFEWLNYSCNKELLEEGFRIEYYPTDTNSIFTFHFNHSLSNRRNFTMLGCQPSKDFNSMIDCSSDKSRATDPLKDIAKALETSTAPEKEFTCLTDQEEKASESANPYFQGYNSDVQQKIPRMGFKKIPRMGFKKNKSTGKCERICPKNTAFIYKQKIGSERYQYSMGGRILDLYTGAFIEDLKFGDVFVTECISCNDPSYTKFSNNKYTTETTNVCYDMDGCPKGFEKSPTEDRCIPTCPKYYHRDTNGECIQDDNELCEEAKQMRFKIQMWNYQQVLQSVQTNSCSSADFIKAAEKYFRYALSRTEELVRIRCQKDFSGFESRQDLEDAKYATNIPTFGAWLSPRRLPCLSSAENPYFIETPPILFYTPMLRDLEFNSFELDPDIAMAGGGLGIGMQPPPPPPPRR